MTFKYPKLAGFGIAVVLAYFIFSNPLVSKSISHLGEIGYFGTLIAGIFYTFGFSSPFSAGFFIDLNPSNILITGIIGGLGAFIGDMLIFRFVKISFKDEFKMLKDEKFIKKTGIIIEKIFGKKAQKFILYPIAAILIASPLPDEAGITLLAGLTRIKLSTIAAISIIFNTIGILILLSI